MRSSLNWLGAAAKEFVTELKAEAEDFNRPSNATPASASTGSSEAPKPEGSAPEATATGVTLATTAGTSGREGIREELVASTAATGDDEEGGWDDDDDEGTNHAGASACAPLQPEASASASTSSASCDRGTTSNKGRPETAEQALRRQAQLAVLGRLASRLECAELRRQLEAVSADAEHVRTEHRALQAQYAELQASHAELEKRLSASGGNGAPPAAAGGPAVAATLGKQASPATAVGSPPASAASPALPASSAASASLGVTDAATIRADDEDGWGWSDDDKVD